MNKEEIDRILEKGKINTWKGNWIHNIGTLTMFLIYPFGLVFLSPIPLEDIHLLFQIFGVLSFLIAILLLQGYLTEGKLKLFETNLTLEKNKKLIKKAFRKLNWKLKEYAHYSELDPNRKYNIHTHARSTIIPHKNGISYNFNYYTAWGYGRFSHLFGIKTRMYQKFKKAVQEVLDEEQINSSPSPPTPS